MRTELLNFEWYTYHLSIDDIDFTIEMIERVLADRNNELARSTQKLHKRNKKVGELWSDDCGEAISDIRYYAHIDEQYLWHFGLWRLQAIFEGMLSQNVGVTKSKHGLKRKLDGLKEAKIKFNEEDYQELLNWAKLRNALSHLPPERFRPGILEKSDVLEYSVFLKRILNDILLQVET